MTDDAAKDVEPPAQLPPASPGSVETAPAAPVHPAVTPYTVADEPSTGRPSRVLPVLLALLCVLALAGAGYSYWFGRMAATQQRAQMEDLEQAVATLQQRAAALEKRPVAAPVDLRPLEQRMTALEQKGPPQVQLDEAGHKEIAALAGRVDAITARQDQLGTRQQADIARLGDQLTAQDTRIAAQDARIASATQAGAAAGGQVDALAAREARLAALQTASSALAAGRPLGTLPNAPPALAQFADKAPPTEAALRLSFADAARAAHEAGMPVPAEAPLLSRMWARMQSSVTIRQGDHVVVGDAVSGVLARAQTQLDAGDLAGAVTILGELSGGAATAMAPWRARAQALLDARTALLTLARG